MYHARVLTLSIQPLVLRVAVAIVLAAYSLPLSLGALSELSHEATHLMERLQENLLVSHAVGVVATKAPSEPKPESRPVKEAKRS